MKLLITDHAVIRYLERILGIDVEAVRDRIRETSGLHEAAALGAKGYSSGGFVYRIENGTVVTIEPGQSPHSARMAATRTKHGHDIRLTGLSGTRWNKSHNARDRRPVLAPEE